MEALHPPPPYSRSDDDHFTLPSLPVHPPPNTAINLPDLRSLKLPTSSQSTLLPPPPQQQPTPSQQWQTYSRPIYAPPYGGAVSLPPPSPMEIDDPARIRAPSIVSLDDPETREAAETLSGLRNMDFHNLSPSSTRSTSSPNGASFSRESPSGEPSSATNPSTTDDPPEPLLSLITSSHPWLGGTINSGMYAYNSTMHYSPAFIAGFVERNMNYFANGLGTVSRRTGVESRVRQYLSSAAGSPRTGRGSSTASRGVAMPTDEEAAAAVVYMEERRRSRASSMASFTSTLPAYEAEGSAPAYALSRTESTSGPSGSPEEVVKRAAAAVADRNWSTRVMITTSGLGVALSDTSLRSLRYCLSMLRSATDHLADVMGAIRTLVVEYEAGANGEDHTNGHANATNGTTGDGDETMTDAPSPVFGTTAEQATARAQALGERIRSYGSDIMATLQSVTTHVSRYTGGALPENAGALVRRQLMSVPLRWRVAQEAARRQSRLRLGSQDERELARLLARRDEDVEEGPMADGRPARGASEPDANDAGSSAGSDSADPLRAGRKWIMFAEQGCEMISQVSLVLSGTVDSAERWLDTMGRGSSGANGTNRHDAEDADDKSGA